MFALLKLVKSSAANKIPDCIQRTPKLLSVPLGTRPLAVTVNCKGTFSFQAYVYYDVSSSHWFVLLSVVHSSMAGVHVMLKTSTGVRYALYSLASSKPEPGGTMPKDCAAFLSQPGVKDIQLYPTGDVRNNYCFHKQRHTHRVVDKGQKVPVFLTICS